MLTPQASHNKLTGDAHEHLLTKRLGKAGLVKHWSLKKMYCFTYCGSPFKNFKKTTINATILRKLCCFGAPG